MWFGEQHPFPERGSPTGLSMLGQQSYEVWACRPQNKGSNEATLYNVCTISQRRWINFAYSAKYCHYSTEGKIQFSLYNTGAHQLSVTLHSLLFRNDLPLSACTILCITQDNYDVVGFAQMCK